MRWRTLYRASQGAKCLSRTSNEAVFATSKLLNDKTYDKHFDYKDIVLLKKKVIAKSFMKCPRCC